MENPILTKELRTRMRGARAFWILFSYLGALSLVLFLAYISWWHNQQDNMSGGGNTFTVGKMFYSVLFAVQALMVGLITPALTAGAVSIEKEQRTYELLSVSLIPRRAIIIGKLLSAVSFVALLLTSSLPLVSLCFLLGGVSPGEVASAYGLLLVTAFLYGAVGVAWSSVSKNTTTATVMAYGTILLLFLGTLPLTLIGARGVLAGPASSPQDFMDIGLTAVNPVGSVTAGLTQETYFGLLTLPAWLPALLVNGLLGVILTLTAIHRLEYPRTDRSPLLRGLIAVFTGLLAFFGFGMPVDVPHHEVLPLAFSLAAIIAPCLLVPTFITGDGLLPNGLRGMLSLWRGQPASGLTYTLLLMGLFGVMLSLRSLTVAPQSFEAGIALTVLSLSIVWGFGTLGLLLSAVTANRWSAFALTVAAMLLLYLVPFGAVLRNTNEKRRSTVLDNVVYLSPVPAAVELSTRQRIGWMGINEQKLFLNDTPFYMVTPVLYALMGIACLAQTGRVVAARRRG